MWNYTVPVYPRLWPGLSNIADLCLCFVFRHSYRKKMAPWYDQYSHEQIAFCSYILGQIALYLQKVICGKNKTSLITYGILLVSGAQVVEFFSTKCPNYAFFIRVKFLFKRKGGEIFGDHNLLSGDQKFVLDRQLASVLKSSFQTLNRTRVSKR